jgi:hypothetical protein
MFLIELFVNMFMCLRLAANDDASFGAFQCILEAYNVYLYIYIYIYSLFG